MKKTGIFYKIQLPIKRYKRGKRVLSFSGADLAATYLLGFGFLSKSHFPKSATKNANSSSTL